MSQEAFGPNLRRIRVQRRISIATIAASTKIAAPLLDGLERNDFSEWPVGVYARAYLRQYADAIGVDADQTIDEFCRWFPQGDRRVERVIRDHAEIVGHELEWQDEVPESAGGLDRRGAAPEPAERPSHSSLTTIFLRLLRPFGKA